MQTKMQAMSKQNVGCARQMQKVSAIPSRPVQQRKSVKVNTASKDVVLNASSFMNPGQVLNRQILEPPSWELPQSAHRISEGLNPKQGRLRVFSGTSNQFLGVHSGCDVFLVAATMPPSQRLPHGVMVMIDRAGEALPATITCVIPYYG
eukprot:gene9459-32443_t